MSIQSDLNAITQSVLGAAVSGKLITQQKNANKLASLGKLEEERKNQKELINDNTELAKLEYEKEQEIEGAENELEKVEASYPTQEANGRFRDKTTGRYVGKSAVEKIDKNWEALENSRLALVKEQELLRVKRDDFNSRREAFKTRLDVLAKIDKKNKNSYTELYKSDDLLSRVELYDKLKKEVNE